MGINNKLYDRNHLGYDKSIGVKQLYVDGTLPNSIIFLPYEGRLQIHNAIGACQARVIGGEDQLPKGYSIYCDNSSQEVVLTWPGRGLVSSALVNPGLESGGLDGWEYTTRGGMSSLVVTSNHPKSGQYSAYWAGAKGLGSEGGIECFATNTAKGTVRPGQLINAKVSILYNPGGGTPKGSRGQVQLNWYDEDNNLIGTSYGFLVKTRKYNGVWTDSVVSDRAPIGASYVKFVSWVTATGAGHTYFDEASWNVPESTGATEKKVIGISIEVTDSAGRSFIWDGQVAILADYSSLVMEKNPYAYWKLDESSGDTIIDSSGNNRHGTYRNLSGSIKGDTPLRLDSSGCFTTTSPYHGYTNAGYITYTNLFGDGSTIGGQLNKYFYGHFALEWIMVKRETTSAIAYVVGFDSYGDHYGPRGWYRYGDGVSRPGINDNAFELNSPTPSIGRVVHMVYSLEQRGLTPGGDPAYYKVLYENGKQVAISGTNVANHVVFNGPRSGMWCFLGSGVADWHVPGSLSDVAIYDSGLTPQEVEEHAKSAGLYGT